MSDIRASSTAVITRRRMLQAGTAGLLTGMMRASVVRAAQTTTQSTGNRWKTRPDLRAPGSASGLEIIQITTDPDIPSSHIYMEAQIFTPDSKRFVLHRSARAHGSDPKDPRHQYLRCDLDDGLSLHPLTHEVGATGLCLSPDGAIIYYFVDETVPGGGRLTLKRVNLDGTQRETIMVMDSPLPDTTFRPSRPYLFSTISSDGQHLAISAFLGDGKTRNAPCGLMIFELARPSVELILHGPTWSNMHPQFCRSSDAQLRRDLLIQENHGCEVDEAGNTTRLVGGDGADIHVIRDDGTNLRNLPWGRDAHEQCQGHEAWRGQTDWAITSTITPNSSECRLIESRPAPFAGHVGLKTPGGIRNELSREFADPQFFHFATDRAGRRLITDHGLFTPNLCLYTARLGTPGQDPLTNWQRLTRALPCRNRDGHMHPFLSPDGRTGFFNSDESGLLQAYLVRGFA